jgi:hypothetical protein
MSEQKQESEFTDAVHNVALAHMRRKGQSGYRWWILGILVIVVIALVIWWLWR